MKIEMRSLIGGDSKNSPIFYLVSDLIRVYFYCITKYDLQKYKVKHEPLMLYVSNKDTRILA